MEEVVGKGTLVARTALRRPRNAYGGSRYVSPELDPLTFFAGVSATVLHLWPMIPKCAAAKSFAGKLLRKPRDGHESWEDWHACWEEFCKSITSESAMMLAVYALRERALLLGLQPTKGASTFSLPDTKPTPRPRADAAETMVPLTQDLPEDALVCQLCPALFAQMTLCFGPCFLSTVAEFMRGDVSQMIQNYALDDEGGVPAASSAAAVAAAAAAAAAVAALDPSKPLPKLKARSHKKKKPEELLANMTGATNNHRHGMANS